MHLDAVGRAKDVLHLTAMDERRKQFALSTITERKSVAEEKCLPGVHCDIGGSYIPIAKEKDKVVFTGSKQEMLNEIEYLIEDGWYTRNQIKGVSSNLIGPYQYLHSLKKATLAKAYIETVRTKEVHNQYSFIPLLIMRDKAQLNTDGIKFKNYIDVNYKLPEELKPTEKRLRAYVFDNAEPMIFYTRAELDREIALMKTLEEQSGSLYEPLVIQKESTRISQNPILELKKTDCNSEADIEPIKELNANDYQDYPVLQQKIFDHLTLKALHAKYFHTSHECSNLKIGTAFFDPFASSIHTKPSRGINRG